MRFVVHHLTYTMMMYTLNISILLFMCRVWLSAYFPICFGSGHVTVFNILKISLTIERLICVMRVDFIKYSRLKVQAQESCCLDSSLGIETYLFYCALQTLRVFFFSNKLKVVAIMYGASLAASFFFFFKQHCSL